MFVSTVVILPPFHEDRTASWDQSMICPLDVGILAGIFNGLLIA